MFDIIGITSYLVIKSKILNTCNKFTEEMIEAK